MDYHEHAIGMGTDTRAACYVEARIEARMAQHSCGPHVSAIREESRQAARALRAAFGVPTHA
jgi:2-isopropylmalate synthase